MSKQEEFLSAAEAIVFDVDYRKRINDNIANYDLAFEKGLKQYSNLNLAKERAAFVKWKVLENLDKYLIEFESSVLRRGGKVIWAHDIETAQNEIELILQKAEAKTVVKSKSMVCEEIGLNELLRKKGLSVYETDLGEYIVDLAGEAPFHIVTPAMHKSIKDIAKLLNEKISSSLEADAAELSDDVRNELRD